VGNGGVDGFGWRLEVGIHLGGGVGWFIEVALSRSFLSLIHGGRQMLGLNSQGLSSPKYEGAK
jgi:hypothetical protein